MFPLADHVGDVGERVRFGKIVADTGHRHLCTIDLAFLTCALAIISSIYSLLILFALAGINFRPPSISPVSMMRLMMPR